MSESWTPLLLVLMKGHPSTGKSSVARCLSEVMHICIIDKDDARDCLTSLQTPTTTAQVLPKANDGVRMLDAVIYSNINSVVHIGRMACNRGQNEKAYNDHTCRPFLLWLELEP
jgi:shikimate kinase